MSVGFLLKGLPSEKQKQDFSDISQVATWRDASIMCLSEQKSYGEWLQIAPWATLVGLRADWNLGTSHPRHLSGLNNLISHPFLLFSPFSQKGCLHRPLWFTESGQKGSFILQRQRCSEGPKAEDREGLGMSSRPFHLLESWGLSSRKRSIFIPTNRYPLFTIPLSSDTLCASLFAWKDLPFTHHPPTLISSRKIFFDHLTHW